MKKGSIGGRYILTLETKMNSIRSMVTSSLVSENNNGTSMLTQSNLGMITTRPSTLSYKDNVEKIATLKREEISTCHMLLFMKQMKQDLPALIVRDRP